MQGMIIATSSRNQPPLGGPCEKIGRPEVARLPAGRVGSRADVQERYQSALDKPLTPHTMKSKTTQEPKPRERKMMQGQMMWRKCRGARLRRAALGLQAHRPPQAPEAHRQACKRHEKHTNPHGNLHFLHGNLQSRRRPLEVKPLKTKTLFVPPKTTRPQKGIFSRNPVENCKKLQFSKGNLYPTGNLFCFSNSQLRQRSAECRNSRRANSHPRPCIPVVQVFCHN